MRAPPTVVALLVAYTAGLVATLAGRPSAGALAVLVAVGALWALLWLTRGHHEASGGAVASETRPVRSAVVGTAGARRSGTLLRARCSAIAAAVVASAAFALTPIALAGGLAVGVARLERQARSDLTSSVGHAVRLDAVAAGLPTVDGDRVELEVRVTAVDGRPVSETSQLTLDVGPHASAPAFTSLGPIVEGTRLILPAARVEPLPEPKPGQFDYGRYLERRGEHVVLAAPLDSLRLAGRRGGVAGLIDRLRLAARAHIRSGLHSPVREVVEAMVLGDDDYVAQQPIDDFRRSGLLHILAVSGENVVLLCTMGGFVLTLARVRRDLRAAILIPFVVVYVVVTGATPSIVRAGVSGVVALLAGLASRPVDGWFLWLVPGAFMLTLNPNVLYDVSFQLSFAAVAGLLLLGRPLTRALGFLPAWLGETAAITAAASVSTAPVSMATFGQASLVAVPANIAGGFVLGPIMWLGMLSVFAGFAWTRLSVPLNIVAGLFTGFLLTVASWFGGLSFAVYEWHGPSLGFLLVAVLATASFLAAWLPQRGGRPPAAYWRGPRLRRGLIAVLACVAVAVALAPAPAAAPGRPTLTILSVGEGAAALLQDPGGPTVLIDAGPAPLAETLRRHGVRRIDLLILSHGHADHTAGLSDVLGRIPVARALVPQPAVPSQSLSRVVAELTAAGVPVRPCRVRVTLPVDEGRLTVLPTGTSGVGSNQDENDCALVVEVTLDGDTVLLPGDAEAEALDPLGVGRCAVAELPHHGSRDGFDDTTIATMQPRVAVVSVGENRFGHPSPEMMSFMAARGVQVLRTDKVGDVTLTATGHGLQCRTQRPAA
ncbi:MAG TPA: ComEC/Rec2 family competence protein [Thermoleophilia bacterium]|nr:ComEC/Rec2 family competence protein [Thermoleophilia bacterium]